MKPDTVWSYLFQGGKRALIHVGVLLALGVAVFVGFQLDKVYNERT